jgi:hypothetical protein
VLNCFLNGFLDHIPEMCSADPKGFATSSQGIRGYIYVIGTLKFT